MFRQLANLPCPVCGVLMSPGAVFEHADKRPKWLYRPGRTLACRSCGALCRAELPQAGTGVMLVLLPFPALAWLPVAAWLVAQLRGPNAGPPGWLADAALFLVLVLPVFPAMAMVHALVARRSIRVTAVHWPGPS